MESDHAVKFEERVETIDPINWELIGTDKGDAENLDHFLSENYTYQLAIENAVDTETRSRIDAMDEPIDAGLAFKLFGTFMGLIPTTAIMGKLAYQTREIEWLPLYAIFAAISIYTTMFVGRVVGQFVGERFKPAFSMLLPNQIALAIIVGGAWGAVAGAAGGVFVFILGSIVGGMIGAMSAAALLPFYTLAFRWLRVGDHVEKSKILPFAFGLPTILAMLILASK